MKLYYDLRIPVHIEQTAVCLKFMAGLGVVVKTVTHVFVRNQNPIVKSR
jgi:hypothetical protein